MKKLVIAAVAALAVISASNVFAMNNIARTNPAEVASDTTDTVAPKPADTPAKPSEEPAKFAEVASDTTDNVAPKPAQTPATPAQTPSDEPVKK